MTIMVITLYTDAYQYIAEIQTRYFISLHHTQQINTYTWQT